MAFAAPILGTTGGQLALAAIGLGIQLAAAYFFPQKVKGPRADSTKAQTAKYGDYLARIHGHGRTAGAAIWLKGDKVDEHKKTERQGGKALGPEVTTYTYTCDCAIAFVWNGPAAAIVRLWADDKLVYDNSAETIEEILNGQTVKATGIAKGASIKIYLGTQDQTPDPDIEADRGVGLVPAWPGIVYLVIKNFPLEEFGIRIPNFEAEIVMQGEERFLSYNIPEDTGNTDILGNTLVTGGDNFSIYTVPNFIHVFSGSVPDGTSLSVGPYITQRGDIVTARRFSVFFSSTRYLWVYDGSGGGLLQTITAPGTGLNNFGSFCDIVVDGINYLFLHDHPDLVCYTSAVTPDTENPSEVAPGEWSYAWINSTMGMSLINGCFSAGPDFLYFLTADTDNIYIIDWPNTTSAVDTLVNPPGLLGDPMFVSYDAETDSVFIGTTQGVFAYNPELDDLLASNTDVTFFTGLTSGGNKGNMPRIDGPVNSGTIIIRHNGTSGPVGDVIQLNKTDLTEVDRWTTAESSPGWPGIGIGGYWVTSPEYSFFWALGFTGISIFFLPRIGRERIPLSEVIAAECGFVGLPNDVSLITGDVEGYVARDNSSPRGVLEDLMRVKFFDFTQANATTKFFMRTASAGLDMNIPEDLGFKEGSTPDNKFVDEEYIDSRELPHRVVLSYLSVEADYREGAQSNSPPELLPTIPEEEVSAPLGENQGYVPIEFSTSLVMTDDEAAQSADIFYNELLDAANIYKSGVGPKYLKAHPGDVTMLDLDEGRTVGAVITKMEGDLAIKMEFLRRTTLYTSDAVGMPTPNNPQSLLGIARIAPIFIDGHLLRAVDDGTGFYTGIYQADFGRFNSGTVFKSNDLGASYAAWLTFTAATLRGIAQVALPDRPHPMSWDRASVLTFLAPNSDGVPNLPSSVTEEQILADDELNGFAVKSGTEWEYIQAAEVTVDSNGLWTLSRMLRGRKGTDFAMAGHAIGDAVIYLDSDTIDRPTEGEKDLVRRYAAIATSTVFTDQYAVTFTNTARGLRPWAPWAITGTRDASGNLVIDWMRRDRLGQLWPEDGPEDPPLSETTEAYKVFIYSMSAGILRTIDTVVSETPYSAADQTTDFGAPVPVGELLVGVVQMSSTYGAGVERTAMI